MSEVFTYVAGSNYVPPGNKFADVLPPIWSDGDPESYFSRVTIEAKRRNDQNFWNDMRRVFEHDLKTLPMERYRVWGSTLAIPIINRHRIQEQISMALRFSDVSFVQEAITDPLIGCSQFDFDTLFRVFDNTNISANRVQALYSLSVGDNMDIPLGMDIIDNLPNYKRIVEIGAGAGDMADVCRKLGFKGEYVIYDFPELLEMQLWLHRKLGHSNNKYISDVNDLESADLVIATWSLTEMPLELRNKVVSKLIDTPSWLIAYSNKIFGYDNHDYIMNVLFPQLGLEYKLTNSDVHFFQDIKFKNIPWQNWDGGSRYLYIDKTT